MASRRPILFFRLVDFSSLYDAAVVPPLLRLHTRDLAKRFGRRLLFKQLSISVEGGGSLAVTGANGSGKSTLLRILGGVLTPSKGNVQLFLDNRAVSRERHPLHVGLVAPYLNVYDGFSPRENLRFVARARRLSNTSDRITDALAMVGLAERMDDPVSTFSSGMKQRVKFAAALLVEPAVLLLDEPRVNLDSAGLAMVARLIDMHQQNGGIVIVATNNPQETERHDQVVRIEDYL